MTTEARADTEYAVQMFNEDCGPDYEAELFEYVSEDDLTITIQYQSPDQLRFDCHYLYSVADLERFQDKLYDWADTAPLDSDGNIPVFVMKESTK